MTIKEVSIYTLRSDNFWFSYLLGLVPQGNYVTSLHFTFSNYKLEQNNNIIKNCENMVNKYELIGIVVSTRQAVHK